MACINAPFPAERIGPAAGWPHIRPAIVALANTAAAASDLLIVGLPGSTRPWSGC